MQMTCRDRNRLAMQADLLGAAHARHPELLCLTGDHLQLRQPPRRPRACTTSTPSTSSRCIKDMRDEKKFQCGDEMDVAPKLYIGCAENPFGDPFEFRALRLKKKIEAGADFMQTQCIFNVPKFKEWMEEVRALGLHQEIKILAGITPLKGAGVAQATCRSSSPAWTCRRRSSTASPAVEKGAPAQAEGKKMAVEMIKELAEVEGVAGVHIMAVEWEDAVPEIVEAAGLMPRPAVA